MSGQCELEVRFHQPPPDLARYFTSFCFGVIKMVRGKAVDDAMQPEWGTLRFFPSSPPNVSLKGEPVIRGAHFAASGPTTSRFDYSIGSTRFWGLGLLPLGWAQFLDTPAHEVANQVFDGERDPRFAEFAPLARILLGKGSSEEEDFDAIVAFFRRQLEKRKPADERIARVHRHLVETRSMDVKAMAAQCELSERTLERMCRKAFGFPPKILLRRQRFMRSLSAYMLDPRAKWSDTIDEQYYDQSHFVRECHEFLGMSPSDYAAMDFPILGRFLQYRAKVKGSPVQTMDLPSASDRPGGA